MRNFSIAMGAVVLGGLAALTIASSYAAGQDSSLLVPKAASAPVQPSVPQTLPAPQTLPPLSRPTLMQPRQAATQTVNDESIPAPSRPTIQPRQAATQTVIDESVSAPQNQNASAAAAAPLKLQPTPRVVYDTDRDARKMYACSGSVEIVMVACNPANGCMYEIPLCIPGCCTGAPSVSSHCGLFGRGVVEYCWPCGFEAIVKFRNIGDIRVDYEGD